MRVWIVNRGDPDYESDVIEHVFGTEQLAQDYLTLLGAEARWRDVVAHDVLDELPEPPYRAITRDNPRVGQIGDANHPIGAPEREIPR